MKKGPLKGEADPKKWTTVDQDGKITDMSEVVVPVLKKDKNKDWHMVGTGFFILSNGIFLTAKHVLMEAFDENGEQKCELAIAQMEGGVFYLRGIQKFQVRDRADIGYGIPTPLIHKVTKKPLLNKRAILSTKPAIKGTPVCTYAYPDTVIKKEDEGTALYFNPNTYDGEILSYLPEGRDKFLVNFPCYETTIVVHGWASGGPVFNQDGHVISINSVSLQNEDYSCPACIIDAFNLVLKDIPLQGHGKVTKSIKELINMNFVSSV